MFPFQSPVPYTEEACIKYVSSERTAALLSPHRDFLGPA